MKTGAQLYTVREFCKTPENLAETLKKVADIGYKTVQVSGTCEYDAGWLRDRLAETGLECPVTHYSKDAILNDPEGVCAAHTTFGCRYIGVGSIPGGTIGDETYAAFLQKYRHPLEVIRDDGKLFLFHTHWMEFMRAADGHRFIEKLCEDFPADLLGITFDTYWAQFAGADPAEWLVKLKGRAPCVHLKDMSCYDKAQRMEPLGCGNMNFKAIFNAAADAGTEYLLVEQDHCYGADPFVCLAKSYEFLKSFGLE